MYVKKQETCIQKTIKKKNWWKKSEMTQRDGEMYHVLGMEESV